MGVELGIVQKAEAGLATTVINWDKAVMLSASY